MVSIGSVTVDVVPDARNFDRDLSAKLNPVAVRAGQEYGRRFAEGLRAELAGTKNPDVNIGVDTGKASAEVDAFLVKTRAKADAASRDMGDSNGNMLAQGMRLSFLRNSPLIASAVAGGLIAGAPLAIAGAGLLFGGIAAVAVKNNAQVHAAAADMANTVMAVFKDTAQVTVPMFVGALQSIGTAFQNLKPQFAAAFSALGGPIGSLTTGVISLVQNAMPGLVAALHNAAPVFQGLASLMGAVGTGLGQFFALVSQHGAAAGQVFSSLGQILGAALPILGRLIDVGVQLGAQILPPVASALGLVAKALQLISPVLPVVLAGFLGFKALSAVSGILDLLSAKLQTVAADGGRLTTSLAGNTAGAVSKLGQALPAVGVGFTLLGIALDGAHKDADEFRTSAEQLFTQLGQGGVAADHAQAKLDLLQKAAEHPPIANGWFSDSLATSLEKAKAAAAQAQQEMGPLAQAQQAVTKARNDYLDVEQKYGKNSGQAAGAAVTLSEAESHLSTVQGQVNDASTIGADVAANLKGQLQLTADAASAAKTQIGLLKGSLDELTGKAVTMDQAEIAVTQAVDAVTQAVKNKSAALVFHNGELDKSNVASAQAASLLIGLADVQHQEISTLEAQGATTDVVKQKSDELRQQFILQAEQLGATAQEAQGLADRYFGIPGQVYTQINSNAADASAAIKTLQDQIDNLHGRNVTIAILSAGSAGPAAYAVPGSGTGGYAEGGPTPPGPKYKPAGVVHAGENVWSQANIAAWGGMANVEALRTLGGMPGFANGGAVPVNIHETAAPFNQALQAAANSARDSMFAGMGPSGSSGGAARWAGLVLQALAIMGQPASLLGSVLRRMNQESGGNPNAINLWDSNAMRGDPSKGLMQVIGSTFARYHHGGTSFNIYDPMANVLASMDYAIARYGSLSAAYNRPGGYAMGTNYVPSDQLAYLHRGEAVVPASANQGAPWQGGPATFHIYDVDGVLLGTMHGAVADAFDMAHSRGTYNG